MPHKVKASTVKLSKAKGNGRKAPYPSLAKAPPAAERLADFLRTSASDAGKAMTEDELEMWLNKFPNLWPNDREISGDGGVRTLRMHPGNFGHAQN